MKRSHLMFALLIVLALSAGQVLPQDNPTPVPITTNILAWREAGFSPQESSPSTPGELGLLDDAGTFIKLLDVPAQASRVQACGDEATSPDGSMLAFYVGLDSGTLYLMKGADSPQALDEVQSLTCLGGGTFQYSPDSNRLGYIAYEADAAASEFADGFLHLVNTSDLSEAFLYENVIAFDLTNEGAAFVSFFTNDRSEADEAAIFWWNGSTEREITTLRPDENCRYTSASVATAPDGSLVVMMGHRCTSGDTRTSWQLHRVNVAERSTSMAASEFLAGQFASFARTNQVSVLPDRAAALFLLPDGITANTAGLMTVNLENASTAEVIQNQAVFPTLSGGANAFPAVSPDGRWLALVTTSPNNDNQLNVIDLNDPSTPPITVSAGSQGDVISSMVFSGDSQHLIFIAGSPDTGRNTNNSLVALDLNTGSDFRIKRGRFAPGLAVAPDGSAVVAMDYQVLEDEREPPYLNLVKINVETSETVLLFEGAEIVDGKVTNPQFAMPVSWRP
jgi:WD40 repeat protein